MYNGIGLQTPRGSGTNGHVQRNVAFMRARPDRIQYNTEATIARQIKAMDRMPNSDILDHERKRQIEVKVAELIEAMREQKFDDAEITERAKALRETLTAKANRAVQSESGVTSSSEKLQVDEHGRLTGRNTHEVTAATNERNRKLREAFRIGEYAPPPVISKEQLEQERLNKYTKQYAIIPDAETVDNTAMEHREKQEELLKLRQMEVLYKDHEKHTRATQEPTVNGSTITSKRAGGSTVVSSNTTAENSQLKKALKRLLKTEREESKQAKKRGDSGKKDSRRDPSISGSSHRSSSTDSRRDEASKRRVHQKKNENFERSFARHGFGRSNDARPLDQANSRLTREFPNDRRNDSKLAGPPSANTYSNRRDAEFHASRDERFVKPKLKSDRVVEKSRDVHDEPSRTRKNRSYESEEGADSRRNRDAVVRADNNAERVRPLPARRSRSRSLEKRYEPRSQMRSPITRSDGYSASNRNRRSRSGSRKRYEAHEKDIRISMKNQQRPAANRRPRSPSEKSERQPSLNRRRRRSTSSRSERQRSASLHRTHAKQRKSPSHSSSKSASPAQYSVRKSEKGKTNQRSRGRSDSSADFERSKAPVKSVARRRSPTESVSSRSRSRSPRGVATKVASSPPGRPRSNGSSRSRSPTVPANKNKSSVYRRSRSRSLSDRRQSRSASSASR